MIYITALSCCNSRSFWYLMKLGLQIVLIQQQICPSISWNSIELFDFFILVQGLPLHLIFCYIIRILLIPFVSLVAIKNFQGLQFSFPLFLKLVSVLTSNSLFNASFYSEVVGLSGQLSKDSWFKFHQSISSFSFLQIFHWLAQP